eukprot:scaffold232132_cov22-Tisochrysis_lutea.AAC.1
MIKQSASNPPIMPPSSAASAMPEPPVSWPKDANPRSVLESSSAGGGAGAARTTTSVLQHSSSKVVPRRASKSGRKFADRITASVAAGVRLALTRSIPTETAASSRPEARVEMLTSTLVALGMSCSVASMMEGTSNARRRPEESRRAT